MANQITDDTIEYVGILAKLELSDAEKEEAKKDMEKMLDRKIYFLHISLEEPTIINWQI